MDTIEVGMAVFAALQQGAVGLHRVAASPAACWVSCAEPEVTNQQLSPRACLMIGGSQTGPLFLLLIQVPCLLCRAASRLPSARLCTPPSHT